MFCLIENGGESMSCDGQRCQPLGPGLRSNGKATATHQRHRTILVRISVRLGFELVLREILDDQLSLLHLERAQDGVTLDLLLAVSIDRAGHTAANIASARSRRDRETRESRAGGGELADE